MQPNSAAAWAGPETEAVAALTVAARAGLAARRAIAARSAGNGARGECREQRSAGNAGNGGVGEGLRGMPGIRELGDLRAPSVSSLGSADESVPTEIFQLKSLNIIMRNKRTSILNCLAVFHFPSGASRKEGYRK